MADKLFEACGTDSFDKLDSTVKVTIFLYKLLISLHVSLSVMMLPLIEPIYTCDPSLPRAECFAVMLVHVC